MRKAILALALVSGLAHADELDTMRSSAPSCEHKQCVGLVIHVASGERGLVTTPAWLASQIATANRHFAPLDVGFQIASIDASGDPHVTTRATRDALAAKQLGDRVIHVFITGQLDDLDASCVIYGVTWRAHDQKYLIVSAEAWERTLAHELGHFFGLPHSSYTVSIMNKTPRDEPPLDDRTFAADELAAMRPVIRRMVDTGELTNFGSKTGATSRASGVSARP